jgi:signal transduction histidine kinase
VFVRFTFMARLMIALVTVMSPVILAAAEPLPRSVLIADQNEPNAPWGLQFRAALLSTLKAGSPTPLVIYSEALDLGRFNGAQYEELLRTYLREKYWGKSIGVIIAHGATTLELLLHLRREIWPSVPVVFGVVDASSLPRLPTDVTGITFRFSVRNAVTAARALVPNLRRIALVGDPFEHQPFRRHFPQEITALAAEVEFIDLLGLPMNELKKRVAGLPDDSVIYYTALYETGIPRDAVPVLAEVANRPIVSDSVTFVGYGSTGGIVALPEPIAEEVARRALRILDGEPVSRIPVAGGDFTKPIFDWRQLQRWKVSEGVLPPGSEIRFREPGLWEQYRWLVLSALAIVLIQAGMIVWLLLEHRRRRHAELDSRRRAFEVAHLNRAAAAGALSASIAHELNQPLGAILSNAETAEILLKTNPLDVEQLKEILVDIRQADQRAADIITHLRKLLKKRSESDLREFNLNDAIADAIHVLEPEAMKRQVTLSVDTPSGTWPVRADPIHLQQVILNLAVNGMDAMTSCPQAQRKLAVQTALHGRSEIEVSIHDQGPGLPNDKLNEVFETFYTTKQQGTGLGLSIVRTIIETYGGKVWAENQASGGAVFRFTLPLAKAYAG